jgi:hypothetical protein
LLTFVRDLSMIKVDTLHMGLSLVVKEMVDTIIVHAVELQANGQ